MLQTLQDTNEYSLTVPVIYNEVPQDITITNKLPDNLKVVVRDKGSLLYYYYRHRKELSLNIDLMEWYRDEGISKIPEGTIESMIRSKLRPTTQLLSIQPDTISVFFVRKAKKEVPVILDERISFFPQYMQSGAPEVFPPRVTVYAPQNVLDQISSVKTELLHVDDLKDTVVYSVSIKPIEGVKFSNEKVKVRINVEEFTERSIMVPVTGLNFPSNESLLSFPTEVKISFLVGLSSYAKIDSEDFQVSIDYTELTKSSDKVHKPVLVKFPATAQNIRIYPEKVDCMIERKK